MKFVFSWDLLIKLVFFPSPLIKVLLFLQAFDKTSYFFCKWLSFFVTTCWNLQFFSYSEFFYWLTFHNFWKIQNRITSVIHITARGRKNYHIHHPGCRSSALKIVLILKLVCAVAHMLENMVIWFSRAHHKKLLWNWFNLRYASFIEN